MKVETFINGCLKENCYLIFKGEKALIIDPGSKSKDFESFIKKKNLKILGILITHYHSDHIGGLEHYKSLYNVESIDYKNKENIKINEFEFKIIKCFGHTLDSVSFYFEKYKLMFTGDFLFKEAIGNYEEKNEKLMYNSLSNILQYNENIKIYPGHDESSFLGYEFENNICLRGLK